MNRVYELAASISKMPASWRVRTSRFFPWQEPFQNCGLLGTGSVPSDVVEGGIIRLNH